MSGFLTSKRLWGATTFVDHVSDYMYVHLMQDLGLDETLLAKEAMEKVMSQAGRNVKQYHADNGRFADNSFINAINSKDQKITFCGVGAHHQNGIIENKNKMLTLGAHTLLLHGMNEAMEKVMAQAGQNVKHYHADNGRFADNGFIDAINSKD